jgi:phosphoribosylglycinamide formyltransferase-1
MKRIGWFTTGRGLGSLGLFSNMLSRISSREIDARLSFVFLNREIRGNQNRARLIAMAEEEGIPVIVLPSDSFRPELKRADVEAWRAEYGRVMREKISQHPMDFGVLAGYMLILDPETCERYDIINLHPALPNTYQGTWEEIVHRVAEGDDDEYGSMVHICTPELDRGATVAYDRFDISDLRRMHNSKEELARAIRAREVRREVPLLMQTIRLLVDGEIRIDRGRLLDREGREMTKYPCLARAIDREIEGRT